MTDEELDKLVEERLVEMMKENSIKLIRYFIIQMGRMCIDSNAEEMSISQDGNYKKRRYKMEAVISIKDIGPEILKTDKE